MNYLNYFNSMFFYIVLPLYYIRILMYIVVIFFVCLYFVDKIRIITFSS